MFVCLAKSHWVGQEQQQGAMLAGVVYAIAAAQLMKMIYVSSAHQQTNTAKIDLASSLYHDYVSLHFYHRRRPEYWCKRRNGGGPSVCVPASAKARAAAEAKLPQRLGYGLPPLARA